MTKIHVCDVHLCLINLVAHTEHICDVNSMVTHTEYMFGVHKYGKLFIGWAFS